MKGDQSRQKRQRRVAGVLAFLGAVGLTALAGCGGGSRAPESPAAPGEPGAPASPAFDAEESADFGGGEGEADFAPNQPAPAPAGATADAAKRQSSEGAARPEPTDRPGLGTEWGETRDSRITTVPFRRGDPTTPFATSSLFYNDQQGANAMASASGFRRFSGGQISAASGVVNIGLKSEGRFLSGFTAGERNYIVGEAGKRYSIVIKSNAPNRIECVVSVDGLDVLDGKPASFKKRGYLIEAHGQIEIEGFRQSTESVAAFRFGSVRGSYASKKHGDTRNVGVIGVALFHERGTDPIPWTRGEINRRHDANPFPGQFATPP